MNKEVLHVIQEKYANKSLNLGDELRNAEIDLQEFARKAHSFRGGMDSMIFNQKNK